jgi:DNA-binding transcriptional LysR family regulator
MQINRSILINLMSDSDWLNLDAKLLRLLVTVVDTGSVTAAAQRLDVTQSAVSHLLDKLRSITGDALFTKSGRGIVATARALALAERARTLLLELERFAEKEHFEPAQWQTTFTIAANDFQRDTLLPALMQRLRQQAPGVSLRVIASDVPTPEMLRQQHCQLIISPRPPEGSDMVQKRLFADRYRVFYDPAVREAPRTRKAYLAAEHVTVLYAPQRPLDLDQHLQDQGIARRFRVTVPGFAGLPAFVRGTDLLVTVPGLLREHLMRGLADAPVPVPCPAMPMYMIWHLRHQQDAAHRWLREQIEAVALPLRTPD